MKLIVLAIALAAASTAQAFDYIQGYTRSDGTYVQPHYRSRPDGIPYNNLSYPGNSNPFAGFNERFKAPSSGYSSRSYGVPRPAPAYGSGYQGTVYD